MSKLKVWALKMFIRALIAKTNQKERHKDKAKILEIEIKALNMKIKMLKKELGKEGLMIDGQDFDSKDFK